MGWGESSSQGQPRMSRPGAALKAWPDAGPCPCPGPLRCSQGPPHLLPPLTGQGHTCPAHPLAALLQDGPSAPPAPWLFAPQGLHSTGRAQPKLVCSQLPTCPPRGGPTPTAPSWAPGCGWWPGPKAKPWWIGPLAVPEAAPQHPQLSAMGPGLMAVLKATVRHHGALLHSCANVFPCESSKARCSGAWLGAWGCAHSYSWAEGHQSHLPTWSLLPGISGLALLPPPLPPLGPPLAPALHLSSISLPWLCDFVTAPCSCLGPSPSSKTEQIEFKSVVDSLLRWNKYFLLAKNFSC